MSHRSTCGFGPICVVESPGSGAYHERMPGNPQSTIRDGIVALGRWMHPGTPFAPRSSEETTLFRRAGWVSFIALVSGIGLTIAATTLLALDIPLRTPLDPIDDPRAVIVGSLLILFSVLAPQASFRTRQAAWTRMIFSDTASTVPSWQRSTVSFDALLVGAVLAGLYFPVAITITAFGWALVIRAIVLTRRTHSYDVNARFHAVMGAWVSGMTALIGYTIIAIIDRPFTLDPSPIPLALAVVIAIYAGLGFQSLVRWGTLATERWAFVRDALDLHRLLVAAVIVGVIWLTAFTGEWVAQRATANADLLGSAAGIAILMLAWLCLWLLSVFAWLRDARHVLSAWRRQQTEVLRRIAEGSLNPELAARAALPTATRVAVAIFGASQARAVIALPDGTRRSSMASAALHRNDVPAELIDIEVAPHRRLRLGSPDGLGASGSVVVVNWLTPGGLVMRSREIVEEYTELTSIAVLGPVISQDYLSPRRAFDTMFHAGQHWPSLTAFEEAVAVMRRQADAAPQSTSLILGVLEIEDFGALSGGKFEQSAVAQVMRLVIGNDDFTGQEVFVAYEEPGRIWIAILGGPVIRQGIGQLLSLQQRINDQGSVTSRRVDVEVSVSVSLGYGSYQVDAVSPDDLRSIALARLAHDHRTRETLLHESFGALDFTPEDITGIAAPSTTVDLLNSLRESEAGVARFDERLSALHAPADDAPLALMVRLGWAHAPGDLDLTDPQRFLDLAERQIDIAVEHLTGSIEAMKRVMAETPESTMPVLAYAPALLLHPDSGAAALPNIAGRLFDRIESSRAVFVFRALPPGSGQAASLLIDRGVGIALDGRAATDVDPEDLTGWTRWGLVLPVVDGETSALDSLAVQQMTTALASHGTRLIAEVTARTDQRRLIAQGIRLVTDIRPHEEINGRALLDQVNATHA